MAGFIEGVNRDQTVLFPERLEDWIGEDHLVRVVDLFVDELDLAGAWLPSPCGGPDRSAWLSSGRPAQAVHLWLSEPHPFQSSAGT